MNKKLIMIILAVVLVGGYAGYSMAKPVPINHDRIKGTLYVLPKAFTLNLADGRYATMTVALLLAPGQSAGNAGGTATLPEGFGGLPEEAAVRDIITNVVTNEPGRALIDATGREKVKEKILAGIKSETDV